MTECCKNCEYLTYYDGYYCRLEKVKDIKNKKYLQIYDIENDKCEMFLKRKGKFWIKGEF